MNATTDTHVCDPTETPLSHAHAVRILDTHASHGTNRFPFCDPHLAAAAYLSEGLNDDD